MKDLEGCTAGSVGWRGTVMSTHIKPVGYVEICSCPRSIRACISMLSLAGLGACKSFSKVHAAAISGQAEL